MIHRQRNTLSLIALLALIGLAFFALRDADSAAGAVTGARPGASDTSDPDAGLPLESRFPARRVARASNAERASPGGSVLETYRVTGRVLQLDGTPVGDVGLGTAADAQRGHARARSRSDGGFTLSIHGAMETLVAIDDAWVTLRAGVAFQTDGREERLIFVAPRVELSGRVVSARGAPLEGARLEVLVGPPVYPSLPTYLDRTLRREFVATSGPDGAFHFPAAPGSDSARLSASLTGYQRAKLQLAGKSSPVTVILQPKIIPPTMLTGSVTDAAGRLLSGVELTLGEVATRSASDGTYRMPRAYVPPNAALRAYSRGFAIESIPGVGLRVQGDEPARQDVVLRAGNSSIRGRIVGAAGTPLKQWKVTVLSAGAERGPVDVTRDEGDFYIGRLAPGSYDVIAWNSMTNETAHAGPVQPGGTPIELRPSAIGSGDTVRGRVVDENDEPITGAHVSVVPPDRSSIDRHARPRHGVTTSADGSFELVDVPREARALSVWGPALEPVRWPLPALEQRAATLELHIPWRFELSLEAELLPAGTEFLRAEDVAGAALQLDRLATGRLGSATLPRSGTLRYSVSMAMRTLIAASGNGELARVAVTPARNTPVTVEWP